MFDLFYTKEVRKKKRGKILNSIVYVWFISCLIPCQMKRCVANKCSGHYTISTTARALSDGIINVLHRNVRADFWLFSRSQKWQIWLEIFKKVRFFRLFVAIVPEESRKSGKTTSENRPIVTGLTGVTLLCVGNTHWHLLESLSGSSQHPTRSGILSSSYSSESHKLNDHSKVRNFYKLLRAHIQCTSISKDMHLIVRAAPVFFVRYKIIVARYSSSLIFSFLHIQCAKSILFMEGIVVGTIMHSCSVCMILQPWSRAALLLRRMRRQDWLAL